MNIKCPSCGFNNIEGADRCEHCLHSMMQRDIPHPVKNDKWQNAMMTAPISNLLTGRDLLVASPEDSVAKIVATLREQKKDCVLVYKKKHLVGIISQRDLLRRVAGKHKNLKKLRVESIMTPNPEAVMGDDPIAFVVNKMATGGFRHVPVLWPDGTPLSIVSIQDVLSYLARRGKVLLTQ